MRLACALLLVFLLPLSAAQAPDGATDGLDPPFDAEAGRFCFPAACAEHLDPRVDLVGLAVWDDAGSVHLRLTTRDGVDASTSDGQRLRSIVRFDAGGHGWVLRADSEDQPRFQLIQSSTYDGGALDDAEGWSGFTWNDLLTVGEEDQPWSYEVSIAKVGLLRSGAAEVDALQGIHARMYAMVQGDTPPTQASAQDELPDDGATFTHEFVAGAVTAAADGVAAAAAPLWSVIEGVDFAGGPSITIADGVAHVAYYVYDAGRGTKTGIYHGTVGKSGLDAERVADYGQADREWRDHATRTSIAVLDGHPAILFAPAPGSGQGLRVAVEGAGGWSVEDLAQAAPHPIVDGTTDGADLAAGAGRLVAAVPMQGERVAVLERQAEGWTMLHAFEQARLPRLAVDPDGKVHVAFMRVDQPDAETPHGTVRHAAEADWLATDVVSGVEHRVFWQTSETDGSYDFALDPAGRPCFAWDTSRDPDRGTAVPDQGFGCLSGAGMDAQLAPLEPVHGNIQLTIRLGFDASGRAAIQSGYGGSDLVAVREADGAWSSFEVPRRDVFDFAVAPDGTLWTAYTEPHGGTTLAVASTGPGARGTPVQADGSPMAGAADGEQYTIPLGGLVPLCAIALALLRRRTDGPK